MIEVKNLTKGFYDGFKKTKVLKGISFKVEKGETFSLVGPNGAGKTTTMKLMLGFLKPETGDALIMPKNGLLQEN